MEWLILLALLMLVPREPRKADVSEDDEPIPDDEGEGKKPYVPTPGASPLWPLPGSARRWRSTSFGSQRPWLSPNPTRHHSGIDIRAKQGDPVLSPDSGTVINTSGWRGPDTATVFLQMDGGPMLVFGAVAPGSYPVKGARVSRGQKIAEVGRYPGGSTMLHLELHKVGTTKRIPWMWGKPQPGSLVDPTNYLLATVDT
jgi:murein DD-endopeptidase MepM/ murein hydrolase activator NlpD